MRQESIRPLAFSYRRWSQAHQGAGSSDHRQSVGLKDFCEYHNLELASRDFVDEGLSGFSGRNLSEGSKLKSFITSVENGSIPKGSWLLIDSMDRLTRAKLSDAQTLIIRILSQDITIGIVSTGYVIEPESRDDMSKVVSVVIALDMAHQESLTRAKRSSGAWNKLRREAESGKAAVLKGGILPGWLERKDGEYKVKQGARDLINRMYSMYCYDELGATAISSQLNREGVVSFTGIPWSSRAVKKLLISPATKGAWQPKTTSHVDGKRILTPTGEEFFIYPKIVPEDLWALAQHVRGNRKVSIVKSDIGFRNAFQKIVFCGCGVPLRYNTRRGHSPSFTGRCNEYGQPCNYRKSVLVSDLEWVVVDSLIDVDVIRSLIINSKKVSDLSDIEKAKIELRESNEDLKRKQDVFRDFAHDKAIRDFYAKDVGKATERYDMAVKNLEYLESERRLTHDITYDLGLLQSYAEKIDRNEQKLMKNDEDRLELNQLLKRHFSRVVWAGTSLTITLELRHSSKKLQRKVSLPSKWEKRPFKPNRMATIQLIAHYLQTGDVSAFED